MAGTGPLAGRVSDGGTSNITPTYAVPDTSRIYEQTGETLAALSDAVQLGVASRVVRKAAVAGRDAAGKVTQALDAGQTAERPKAGHGLENFLSGGAYQRAFETAALVKLKGDIDTHDDVLRAQHQYDPEGYKAASAKVLSGYIQGAPEELAVAVESYGQGKFDNSYGTIARVAEERHQAEAAQAIGVRIKQLDGSLKGMALAGQLGTDGFDRAEAERSILQAERTQNPAILYSSAQGAYDDEVFYDELQGAAATHGAAQSYGEAGGGLPGKAAALRFLDTEVLNGADYADMDPARRARIHKAAKDEITRLSADDVAAAQEERQKEREDRAVERDKVGSLLLDVQIGSVSEKSVLARGDLSDESKVRLVSAIRSQSRRDAAEARSAASAARVGTAAMYREYSDQAASGDLSEAEIADAVHAGLMTKGQAMTLRHKRDKSLKPIIDVVMAPVKDRETIGGRRASAVKTAIAEEASAIWAARNPRSTMDEQFKAGESIAKSVYGAPKPAAAPGRDTANKTAKYQRAKKEYTDGKISHDEFSRRMKALNDGG